MRGLAQRLLIAVTAGWMGYFCPIQAADYSLTEAIERAHQQDLWLEANRLRQQSLESTSVQAGTFPDPTVSLAFANVPIDSFDFNQEPMTQFKVAVTQMFPRGGTSSVQQEKFKTLSQMQPLAREDRKAQVAVTVSHLWLEVYRSEKTITYIAQDRELFEHLVDVAQSNYTSAVGRTRQQDLVRAQLELTRLEDRLIQLRLHRETQLAQLGEWLADASGPLDICTDNAPESKSLVHLDPADLAITQTLDQLAVVLAAHPKVRALDYKVRASASDITLSQQSYKPQWGVNASYGYRDDDPLGNDRSDFFSVGVSFDVPLFTGNRQDKQVQAATAEYEALKTERALMLRELRARFEKSRAQYRHLLDRKTLYQTRLLKEMSEQAEAALTAYTHDDGDFSEVVRARIAELNARIEALNVEVDIHKVSAQLRYFLVGATNPIQNSENAAKAANGLEGLYHHE